MSLLEHQSNEEILEEAKVEPIAMVMSQWVLAYRDI